MKALIQDSVFFDCDPHAFLIGLLPSVRTNGAMNPSGFPLSCDDVFKSHVLTCFCLNQPPFPVVGTTAPSVLSVSGYLNPPLELLSWEPKFMHYSHKSSPVWPSALRTTTHQVVRRYTELGFSIGTLGREGCSPSTHLRLA